MLASASPVSSDLKYENLLKFDYPELSMIAMNWSQKDCHWVTSPSNVGISILGRLASVFVDLGVGRVGVVDPSSPASAFPTLSLSFLFISTRSSFAITKHLVTSPGPQTNHQVLNLLHLLCQLCANIGYQFCQRILV